MATAVRERPEGEAVALDEVLGESVNARRGDDAAMQSDNAAMQSDNATMQNNITIMQNTIHLQNELAATKELLQKADQERQMCLEKIAQLQADNQEMAEDLAAKVAVEVRSEVTCRSASI